MNTYNADPYTHAEAFDYDAQYQYDQAQTQQHQYPPVTGMGRGDYATQEESIVDGYADLHRGNSVGSGSGHGHDYGYGHGSGMAQQQQHVYPGEFPMAENYLGRPTGGSDGP
jgi:hypothetical protein